MDKSSSATSQDKGTTTPPIPSALKIQTENLPPKSTASPKIAPARSYQSINGSFTSSPIVTPSGSTFLLPSTSLTPLPSPLVTGGQFSSNLSLDQLSLASTTSSPRRKGYGALGSGPLNNIDKRITTEYIPGDLAPSLSHNRSVSSLGRGRVATDEGLRREDIIATRSRQSSVGEEVYDLEYWRTPGNEWRYAPVRYIKSRSLGRGTFSKVVLSEPLEPFPENAELPPLLAVKVVHLDATDDAPAERITSSAKRELDILKIISHPCITRLLAYTELPDRCFYGLQLSNGGDLFDFASRHKHLLTPILVKIIFKELVLAVQYLHEEMHIVHRDLKLENVLLNYPASDLANPEDVTSPVVCLTDLGLSRPYDPASPLLTTRCGSTDYAAPEIMLGQPYDGRATDAWALGVILYCLLESRLPFDPPPDARRPGKVAHRIAMGQWKWYRLARERRTMSGGDFDNASMTVTPGGIVVRPEGEGTFMRGGGVWEGGMEIVEGLLRRKPEMRWTVGDILKSDWLQ